MAPRCHRRRRSEGAPRCQFRRRSEKAPRAPSWARRWPLPWSATGPGQSGNHGRRADIGAAVLKGRRAANSAAVPKGRHAPRAGRGDGRCPGAPRAKLERQPWRRAANSRRRSKRRRAAIGAAVPKGAALPESGAPGLAPGCLQRAAPPSRLGAPHRPSRRAGMRAGSVGQQASPHHGKCSPCPVVMGCSPLLSRQKDSPVLQEWAQDADAASASRPPPARQAAPADPRL
jgi:hypothetical protein